MTSIQGILDDYRIVKLSRKERRLAGIGIARTAISNWSDVDVKEYLMRFLCKKSLDGSVRK